MNIDSIYQSFNYRTSAVTSTIHRYLYDHIDWSNRLIAIKGARGCGKTTLILQRIKEHFHDSDNVIYISLDDLWFADNNLPELIANDALFSVTKEEIEQALDPKRYTGLSAHQTERFLETVVKPLLRDKDARTAADELLV